MTAEHRREIEEKLAQGWSPCQTSGRLQQADQQAVGRQWIYNSIHADRIAGGTLYLNLRRKGKKRNWKGRNGAGRGHIPGRVDISERPAVVEKKSRIGDWELDTIIGAGHNGALVSAVERMSKKTILARIDVKTAEATGAALTSRLSEFPDLVLTLTSDNGKEFAGHASIAKALKAKFYFAKPYHSWERGLNEHTNGLVREYYPKSTDFRTISEASAHTVEERLNSRPRKVLGYLTPDEVFATAQTIP